MARCPALGRTFALILDVSTAVGKANMYSTSQVKDYRVMPETTTRLRSNDYEFGMQTNSGSRVDHYRFVVVTYSGQRIDQYWSPH